MQPNPLIAVIHHLQTLPPRDMEYPTDAQLMESFITRKDEAAFHALVQRHGQMVYGVCRRLLRNHHDAEDAFQATFLVLARNAVQVRPTERVGNWLHGVAYNTALKARERAARRLVREHSSFDMSQVEDRGSVSDSCLELYAVLDRELACLPEKYRLPIVLCDLEGKSIREATRQLDWPQGTLAGRLAKGRAILSQRLARHGLNLSAGSLAVALSQTAAAAAVSSSVLSAASKAALRFASSDSLTPTTIPSEVAFLANGGVKSMLSTKLKLATLALAATIVGIGLGTSGSEAQPSDYTRTASIPESKSKPSAGVAPFQTAPFQIAGVAQEKPANNLLQNPGIEDGDKAPAHWSQGADIEGVEYIWDKKTGYKSKASLCLHKTADRYFPIAQWYQIVERKGNATEISVSAQVKAEKVHKAILDVIFLDNNEEWIKHEWAAYIGIKKKGDEAADHDWKEYYGQVKIPKDTKKIQVCLQIYGPGKVWFDEVRAEYAK